MSLKYLLPAIQSRPEAIKISEEEFGKLLNDVISIGREKVPPQKAHDEFLSGCERMLSDITKAYPIEAEPFMKPVTKKIAPDYDKVISEPMDIGTMQKKIRAKEYRNKTQFARDLTLIWENCLKYNADPHPVRSHATFMQRLANHHLRFLPDKNDVANALNPEYGLTGKKTSGAGDSGSIVAGAVAVVGNAEGAGEATGNVITGFRPTANAVAKTRAILCDGQSLLSNRKRLGSSSTAALPEDPKRRKLEPPAWFPSETVVPTDMGKDDETWWAELAPIGSALPRTSPASSTVPVSAPSTDRASRPSESLSHRISQNITLMQSMRETASLLSALANGSIEDHPAADKDLRDHSIRVREFKRARTRSSRVINEGVAASQLRLATGVMLSHAGFEGCNSMALDFVSQIASDYLMGLGKTATLLTDRVSQTDPVSASSLIEKVLGNNGNVTTSELDDYVQDDVFRYGAKLDDMHKKLRQALDEQVEPDEDDDEIGEDVMLFGGMPGMGDMDDFLGLGGMGAIPKKLLRDRKSKAKSEPKEPEAPPLEYPGPPPFLPLTPQDIPFQIGILRPFYLEKVAQARAQAQAASENAEADQGLGLHADSDSKMDVDPTANALADQEWDPTMTQLGAFGQVVVRGVGAGGKKPQDKKEERKAKRAKNRGAAGAGAGGAPEEALSPEAEP